jgi:hypothetical protein
MAESDRKFYKKEDRHAVAGALGRRGVEPVQRPASGREALSLFVECVGGRPGNGVRIPVPAAWDSGCVPCIATAMVGRNVPKSVAIRNDSRGGASGHYSNAVHRKHAKRASIKIP